MTQCNRNGTNGTGYGKCAGYNFDAGVSELGPGMAIMGQGRMSQDAPVRWMRTRAEGLFVQNDAR